MCGYATVIIDASSFAVKNQTNGFSRIRVVFVFQFYFSCLVVVVVAVTAIESCCERAQHHNAELFISLIPPDTLSQPIKITNIENSRYFPFSVFISYGCERNHRNHGGFAPQSCTLFVMQPLRTQFWWNYCN